jgi:tetratricopeptide (TPR) repeat protein
MLNGMPESVEFQRQLARGYMLSDKPEEALQTWLKILEANPEHYDTILDVGNYYEAIGDHASALPYLRRANAIHSTPYLTQLIN